MWPQGSSNGVNKVSVSGLHPESVRCPSSESRAVPISVSCPTGSRPLGYVLTPVLSPWTVPANYPICSNAGLSSHSKKKMVRERSQACTCK